MTIDDNTAIVARENHPFVFTVNGVRFFPGADAKLSYRSMGIDTAHFSELPPGLIKPNDTVEVYYLGNRVFTGTAEKIINHQSSGRDRSETVLCHGPWGKMNRFVFRQQWCAGTKNNQSYTFSSSRVILNQSALGVRMSMSEQLHEIATFAQDVCGFCIGDISASSLCLPLDETRDITCASAIQRELRFFPKKVVSFDYSHNPPALNITDPDTSTDSPYIATIPQSQRSYEYTAHPIASVDISTELVELETSSDKVNSILRSLKHQVYPENADTDDIDCLKVFIPLQKGSASTSWESFESVTESIPSLNDASWWKSKHPRLANVDINQIEIRDAFRTDDNAYPNIAAATSDQLEAAGLSCEVSRFSCTCKITTEDDIEDDIILTMDFLTTDATTRTYTWQTGSSFTEGESLPEGLAKAIFEQRSGKLLNEDIAIRLGNEFPHLGDTVDGLILQAFEVDCCNLEASLHFGHPEHLSVEDMRDLLNGFRQRASASNAVLRSAESPEEEAEEQGTIQPINSTEFSPGVKSKTTFKEKEGSSSISFSASSKGGNVDIDTEKLADDETLEIHSFQPCSIEGCGSRREKPIKMLSTEDIVIPGVTSNPETDGIDVTYDPEKKVHKITNKGVLKIKAGNNVKVDNETGVVTISVAIPETSPDDDEQGVSATVPSITDIMYSPQTHQLVAMLQELTFTNGILTDAGDKSERIVFTATEHEKEMDG